VKIVRTLELDASPARALEVLCEEGYNVERERSREEVVSTRFALVRRSEEETVFELRSVEYRRGKLGALDRSGTCESLTTSRSRPREGTLTWSYSGGSMGSRATLGGVYRLTPRGPAGARLVHEITIEVHVPLIGGQIAKVAGREFEKACPGFEAILLKHL